MAESGLCECPASKVRLFSSTQEIMHTVKMNTHSLQLPSLPFFVSAGLLMAALCAPLGMSANESAASDKVPALNETPANDKAATGDKAPAKDKVPAEPVWYWVKSIDIPVGNPLRKKEWDKYSAPDLMIVVERNGVILGESDAKEDCWTCVYEKKYQNLFPFREDRNETYTITIFDYDRADPNDSMLQIVINGDDFNKDEVVIREKAAEYATKESLVTVTFVRISKEEKLKLQKAAGK